MRIAPRWLAPGSASARRSRATIDRRTTPTLPWPRRAKPTTADGGADSSKPAQTSSPLGASSGGVRPGQPNQQSAAGPIVAKKLSATGLSEQSPLPPGPTRPGGRPPATPYPSRLESEDGETFATGRRGERYS